MPFYNDERLRKVRIGIDTYTNNELVLDVIGNTNIFADGGLGINTTNSEGYGLYVNGDGYFTGVVTARTFYAGPTEITGGAFADDLTVTTLKVNGISTLGANVGAGETSTFIKRNANIEEDLFVGGDANITGILTVFRLEATELATPEIIYTLNDLSVTGFVTYTGTDDNILGDVNTGILQIDGGAGLEKNVSIGASLWVGTEVGIGSTQPTANLDVAGTVNVSGASTFRSDVDITGDLTVDGLSDLDELNVAGIATFNDDVNFIGPTAGVTSAYWDSSAGTLNFRDTARATFGDGNDLQIYHDGSNSYIENTTGSLYIRDNGNNVYIQGNSGESSGIFRGNGAVELYYDNSKKFETTGYGVTVSGGLTVSGVSTFQDNIKVPDDVKIQIGDFPDLEIYHTSNQSYIRDTGAGDLNLESDNGSINLRVNGTDSAIIAKQTDSVELYFNNSKKFETTGYGVTVSGGLNVSGVSTFQDTINVVGGNRIDFSTTNIRIGDETTGASITSGTNNFFAGVGAGCSNTSGSENNFFGEGAGYYNTFGDSNNFFGYYAGYKNIGGSCNNFLGGLAGYNNLYGQYNNFFGYLAGYSNTNGSNNNFFGLYTGSDNETGSNNNFLGFNAGSKNTTGNNNNFIGEIAGRCNETGSGNNSFGFAAGYANISGCRNNFIGYRSGICNTTGSHNTFLGTNSGLSTSASRKIILGSGSPTSLFDSPDTTKDTQFAVGVRTDSNPSNYWLVGDENFNIGIGTTNPSAKLDVNGTLNVTGVSTFQDDIFLGDTDVINLGDSNELQIQHRSNGDSSIVESGSGQLYIGANRVNIASAYNNNFSATFNTGATGEVALYYGNVNKFETTGFGVTVFGGLNVSGVSTFQDSVYIDQELADFNGSFGSFDQVLQSIGTGVSWTQTTLLAAGQRILVQDTTTPYYITATDITSGIATAGFIDTDIVSRNGNIGIGSTQPISTLDVNGTLNVTGVSTFQDNVYLGDGDRIMIGDSNDLQIYHNGSTSYVSDVGSGELNLGGSVVNIRNAGQNEFRAVFNQNEVELYYNNAKKFETTGFGVTVTGGLNVSGVSTFQDDIFLGDNDVINLGDGNDLQIYHDGSDSYVKDNGTGQLILQGFASILLQSTSTETYATFNNNGSVELNYDNSKKFETTGYGVSVTGGLTASGISTITDTTDNTLGNVDTGALQIDGGLGVAKNVSIGGSLYVQGQSEFIGVVTFRGGTINIGDQDTDDINVGGEFVSSLVPNDDDTYDLGSPTKEWRNLYVDGLAEIDDLNVSGLSTFGSNVDIDASVDILNDLTVDGLSDLDELNVAGISTFASDLDVNASIDVSTDLTVDGLSDLDELNVAGISTFASDLDVNASVDISNNLVVDGLSDLDELNVAGISTFASDLDVNASVDILNDLTVDGLSDLDELNVAGLSTFASDLDVNASVDISTNLTVDGLSDLDELNVAGLSTFTSNVDINASVDISQTLNVTGVATFGNDVEITGDLTVNGTQTILNTQILEVEDINIGIASADPKLSDAALDGAGITIHGAAGDKTLTWSNANSRMGFNTDLYSPNFESTNITANGNLVVDGLSDLDELNVAGIATFNDQLSITNGTGIVNHFFDANDRYAITYVGTGGADILIDPSGDIYLNATSNGNVGIKTNAPSAELDVVGDARISGILTVGSASVVIDGDNNSITVGTGASIYTPSNNELTFGTNNQERVRIDSNGNVGINAVSPTATLYVAGTTNVTGVSTFQDNVNIGTGGTTAFFDVSSGRVGINTVTPSATFEVNGDTNISGTVGIGTSNSEGYELYVNGDGYFTGVVTATTFYAGPTEITGGAFADDLTVTTLKVNGISTLGATNVGAGETSTFIRRGANIQEDLFIGNDLYVSGVSTFVGVGTFSDDLYIGGSLNVVGVTTFTNNVIVDSNLGVGTDNPTSGFADPSNTSIINTGIVTANQLYGSFYGDGSNLENISADGQGEDGAVQYNNGGLLAGASDFFYDDVNNRVGIGSTVPTVKLDVDGDVNITGIVTAQEFVGIGSQLTNITFRQLSDVDGSNLVALGAGTTTPDYLVIYDPLLDAFRFVDPKSYFGINNDADPAPDIVDYGPY